MTSRFKGAIGKQVLKLLKVSVKCLMKCKSMDVIVVFSRMYFNSLEFNTRLSKIGYNSNVSVVSSIYVDADTHDWLLGDIDKLVYATPCTYSSY